MASHRESSIVVFARQLRSGFLEVCSQSMGKLGIILLAWFIAMSIYALIAVPPSIVTAWSNPKAWQDYPSLVPPAWISIFGVPVAPHMVKIVSKPSSTGLSLLGYQVNYTVTYVLPSKAFPNDRGVIVSILSYKPVKLPDGTPVDAYLTLSIMRPDGLSVVVYSSPQPITGPTTIRIEPLMAARQVLLEFNSFYHTNYTYAQLSSIQNNIVHYLFGKPTPNGGLKPYPGAYIITLTVTYSARGHSPREVMNAIESSGGGVGKVKFVVAGSAYGLCGTDNIGRDLWEGILYSFPIELLIGVFAAVVATAIGVVAGIVSGYYGGWIDEFIQRFVDVMSNVPLLPILVLIGAIVQATLLNPWDRLMVILLVIIIFSWGWLAIMVRSMTLSIKAEPYVEAAKALGASDLRIMLRYVLPQIMPYVMANLVFAVPGAILTEAGISVLGIEHGLPTWGRILADARASMRYDVWWWIFPPGILIALISLCFVLLGMAIEVIVEPRLRGR